MNLGSATCRRGGLPVDQPAKGVIPPLRGAEPAARRQQHVPADAEPRVAVSPDTAVRSSRGSGLSGGGVAGFPPVPPLRRVRGQYLRGSGRPRGWTTSWRLPSRSGWCSRCRWGSRWRTATARTGRTSSAGLCPAPRRSLQDKAERDPAEGQAAWREGCHLPGHCVCGPSGQAPTAKAGPGASA